jgi:hypothetical protein
MKSVEDDYCSLRRNIGTKIGFDGQDDAYIQSSIQKKQTHRANTAKNLWQ